MINFVTLGYLQNYNNQNSLVGNAYGQFSVGSGQTTANTQTNNTPEQAYADEKRSIHALSNFISKFHFFYF